MLNDNVVFITSIILIGIIGYLADLKININNYTKCKDNILFHLNLLFHHIISIFLFLGWISNDKRILYLYFCLAILTGLGWTFNGNCFITVLNNELCELPLETHFQHIPNMLGLEGNSYSDTIQTILIIFGACFSFNKIRQF
jgi:hypothetical protein